MCCHRRGPREAKHFLCVASGGGSSVNFNFIVLSLLKILLDKELIKTQDRAVIA